MGAIAASSQGINTSSTTDLVTRLGSKAAQVALSTYSNSRSMDSNLMAHMDADGDVIIEVRKNGKIVHVWRSADNTRSR